MRNVQTTFTCDLCGLEAKFVGVRDDLPSHWTSLTVTDGSGSYSYRHNLLCLTCRHALDDFFTVGGEA